MRGRGRRIVAGPQGLLATGFASVVTFVGMSCIATREHDADHDCHPSCPRAKVASRAAQAGCWRVRRAADPTSQPWVWPCSNDAITLSRCAMSAPHRAHAGRQRSPEQNEAAELGQWLRYEPKGRCDRYRTGTGPVVISFWAPLAHFIVDNPCT